MHTDIESCVVNNGFSTEYFPLQRGTRQGDTMASYLFILIIEILTCMVKQKGNITGIFINGQEMKKCQFADDSTYLLQDIVSLRKLKSTISVFPKYSSLNINNMYEKSPAAWIGPYVYI